MTPERWARLRGLFNGAMEQDAGAREAWLRNACGGDGALLAEVRDLLHADATAGDFLDRPAEVDLADLADAAWKPGDRIGNFEIVESLGRGGMGVVYLAVDQRLGRRVAVKALPADVAANPALRERLRREARAAATIAHPSVATVYSLDEVDGHLLLVSEYVEGSTLRALIDRGPMAPSTARAIATDVARGLHAAHTAGIVHRDLKPENVLVVTGGVAKLVDFGIAYVEGLDQARMTRAGAIIGTPAYMAPEQLLGGAVDARTDIYSFGVVLLEMLSGQHPIRRGAAAGDPATEAAPIDPLAAALRAIADTCRHPDPAMRYQSAQALADALQSLSGVASGAAAAPMPARSAAGMRWWWEFHQGATAAAYALILAPAWLARSVVGGSSGRVFFVVTACAATLAITLRLHLWFTSRQHPAELRWARQRAARWVRLADGTLVAALVAGAALVNTRSALDMVLLVLAVSVAVAFLIIEPVTARAAGLEGERVGG